MRKHSIWMVLGAILCIVASGQAEQHPVYYDCALGRTTTLVITNLTDQNAPQGYSLRIYDAFGAAIHESAGGLAPHESVALHLLSLLDGAGSDDAYGLAIVESPVSVGVSAWYREDEFWATVETGGRWSGEDSNPDAKAYWYYLQFADTDSRTSGFYLVNPSERHAMVTVYLRDSDGKVLAVELLPIQGRETWFFMGEDLIYPETFDEDVWGIVDVRSPSPLILVGEYYDSDGWLIDLDVSKEAYRIEGPQG